MNFGDEPPAAASARPSSVALGILSLPGEELATRSLIAGLLDAADEHVTIDVLINGRSEHDLDDLAADDRVTVKSADRNLGVAGGRNVLLRGSLDRGADIVGFLDNDLICFDNIFEVIRRGFREHQDADVLGVALFEFAQFRKRIPTLVSESTSIVDSRSAMSTPDWPEAFASTSLNLGSNPDLDYAYLSPEGLLYEAFRKQGGEVHVDRRLYNSALPDLADRFADGDSLHCGNVPGGVSFFRSASLLELGALYDEAFGPYGAEDVDLSWRLQLLGSHNRVLLGTGAVHGTTDRQRRRRVAAASFADRTNGARVRTLLAKRHGDGPNWESRSLAHGITGVLARSIAGVDDPDTELLAWLVGSTIAKTESPDGRQAWAVDTAVDLPEADPGRFGPPSAATSAVGDVLALASECRSLSVRGGEPVDELVARLTDRASTIAEQLLIESEGAAIRRLTTLAAAGVPGARALESMRERHREETSRLRRDLQTEHRQLRSELQEERRARSNAAIRSQRRIAELESEVDASVRRAEEARARVAELRCAHADETERLRSELRRCNASIDRQRRTLNRRIVRMAILIGNGAGRVRRAAARIATLPTN